MRHWAVLPPVLFRGVGGAAFGLHGYSASRCRRGHGFLNRRNSFVLLIVHSADGEDPCTSNNSIVIVSIARFYIAGGAPGINGDCVLVKDVALYRRSKYLPSQGRIRRRTARVLPCRPLPSQSDTRKNLCWQAPVSRYCRFLCSQRSDS